MKKRSGVCSANIQSVRLSQRSHVRGSAKDGGRLQLPFSLVCTSSHIINKLENKQRNPQARTPAAVPSDPEGNCDMLSPVLGWASAVSEPGSSGTRKTMQQRRQDVKTSRRHLTGEREKMPEKPRGERTSFASFACSPQRYGATHPGFGSCPPCRSGMIDTALHARQYRTRGAQQMKQIEARGPNGLLTSYSWQISWPQQERWGR